MRNPFKYKSLFIILLLTVTAYSCTPSGEKKLNRGIELFNKGEKEKAVPYLEEGIISTSNLKKINNNNILFGRDVLYIKAKNLYKILWPIEMELETGDGCNIINFSNETKKIGISNGFDIKIYDIEGNLIKTLGPVKDENPEVKAFIILNNVVYYYRDKRIYMYDLQTDNKEFLTNDKFDKPFSDDMYNVEFTNDGNILALTIGIAGKYNLFIIDLINNSVISKNIKTASSKIDLKNNEIYYVNGDAGKYSLVRSDIKFRKKETIINFESLIDIGFYNNGVIFEEKDGLWVSNFEGENRQKINFNYKLAGICGDNPVFKYLNAYYVMDMDKLLNQLSFLKEAVPAISNN